MRPTLKTVGYLILFQSLVGDTIDESQENNASYSLASRLVILNEVPDGQSLDKTMRISAIQGGVALDGLKFDSRYKFLASTIAVGNGGMA